MALNSNVTLFKELHVQGSVMLKSVERDVQTAATKEPQTSESQCRDMTGRIGLGL